MHFFLKNKAILFFVAIVIVAFSFRVIGINWDQNQHLHPDERFLTMVVQRLEIPVSMRQYLDPSLSPMNPYNKETGFYVYGVLPLTIVKLVAIAIDYHTYDGIAIVGRLMSAIFDMGTLFLVYKILLLFKKRTQTALLGMFIYAVLVLPIQLSHFFVVDTFLVFFTTSSVYFAIRFYLESKKRDSIISAILFAAAISCKISALYVAPLIGAFLVLPQVSHSIKWRKYLLFRTFLCIFLGVIVYVVVRFTDPHLFQNASFLDLTPAVKLIANMKELSVFASNKSGYFPPSVQWYKITPVVFALKNIAVFGVGVPIFICFIIGLLYVFKKGDRELRIISAWVLLFFLFQSTRFSPSMRYFYFLYPFISIIGALGVERLLSWFKISRNNQLVAWVIVMIFFIVWPLGFVHIYRVPHSRVSASYWIYQNIPSDSVITMEHWDDGLPLRLPDVPNTIYKTMQLPVFAEDSTSKWDEMNTTLKDVDYLIMSSNRGYGSIMGQTKMYPIMSRWYADLFAGKLGYSHLKTFTSFPTWCVPFTTHCVEFDDQWSEEAFTVYDHPKVSIFKKIK